MKHSGDLWTASGMKVFKRLRELGLVINPELLNNAKAA